MNINNMKTLDVEIAMLSFLNVRQNIIVPNVSWGMGVHECDLLMLTKTGYATEFEIKVSKADLKIDNRKGHGHRSNLIKYLYFVIPEKLKDIALDIIPKRSGLYIISEGNNRYYVKKIRKAEKNRLALKWTYEQRLHLAHLGVMRILTLKKTISLLLNITKKGGNK